MKKLSLTLTFAILMFVAGLATTAIAVQGIEIPICTDPASQAWPAISGNRIVWSDDRNGSRDIYMYDLSSGIETPICTAVNMQAYQAISGNRIVWLDRRNGNYDIYMYDLSSDSEIPICTDPAIQFQPAISGDRIVWADARNGRSDIFGYDLSTQNEFTICTAPENQISPAISGDIIVWMDYRNGSSDIYLFELLDPVDLLLDLTQDVIELNLQQGIANGLDAKLYAAMQALDDINENNNVAAINTLEAFVNAVEAQRGNKIPEADADDLIADVLEIIDLLSTD